MATAKKLPSGSWRCRVYSHTETVTLPDGTQKEKKIYKSFTYDDPSPKGKRSCEKEAAEWAAMKEIVLSKPSGTTFGEALKKLIDQKAPVLSPATIKEYNGMYRILNGKYIDFCQLDIYSISNDDIQRVVNNIASERSPKTVRNYHAIITSVLKDNNVNLVVKTTMPQKILPKLHIPSDDEIKRLIDGIKNTELEIPVLLAAFCTMRRGEICALSMDDIDGCIIHVHHSLVLGPDKKWHLKPPKTKSSDRYVDAPEFVISRIREHGYITTMNPTIVTQTFRRTLRHLGIPHFRFHDLRHYSASVQHALGIPDAYIMQRGGWSSDNVLKSVYRHALDDRKREMNEIANGYFKNLYDTKI